MENGDTFSIFFHHGGNFISLGSNLIYGGQITSKHGLDYDRFGFLDLVEEVENLGYGSWDKLYRAKKKARNKIHGSVTEHYAKLRSYVLELLIVDKDGRFELQVGAGSIFKAIYIGFSALRRGFLSGCRRVIGIDGCFLKTYLGGVLLSAIAKDGNNQMYPIAWAVVEVENESCWNWFLNILFEELGIGDGHGLTIISDQQKAKKGRPFKNVTPAVGQSTTSTRTTYSRLNTQIQKEIRVASSGFGVVGFEGTRNMYMRMSNDIGAIHINSTSDRASGSRGRGRPRGRGKGRVANAVSDGVASTSANRGETFGTQESSASDFIRLA